MLCMLRYASPLGELKLAAGEKGLRVLVMSGQRYERLHLPSDLPEAETPTLLLARDWLDAYFAGERPDIGRVPLDPAGTDFQRRVWQALTGIPYGETLSYGDLAQRLRSSARAVGAAVGRNPISILIPCHRVLGKNGSLTGYAGGLERKAVLLTLEGAQFRNDG